MRFACLALSAAPICPCALALPLQTRRKQGSVRHDGFLFFLVYWFALLRILCFESVAVAEVAIRTLAWPHRPESLIFPRFFSSKSGNSRYLPHLLHRNRTVSTNRLIHNRYSQVELWEWRIPVHAQTRRLRRRTCRRQVAVFRLRGDHCRRHGGFHFLPNTHAMFADDNRQCTMTRYVP